MFLQLQLRFGVFHLSRRLHDISKTNIPVSARDKVRHRTSKHLHKRIFIRFTSLGGCSQYSHEVKRFKYYTCFTGAKSIMATKMRHGIAIENKRTGENNVTSSLEDIYFFIIFNAEIC